MRTTLSLAALGAAALFWAAPVHGQSCNATVGSPCSLPPHTLRATAPTIAQLTKTSGGTTFPALTAADFDNPAGTDAPGVGLTVVANVDWTITVATGANSWSGPAGTSKNSTDLRILIGGVHTGLTTTAQTLASGGPGTPPAILAQFNALWHFATDEPGPYQISAIFTMSTP